METDQFKVWLVKSVGLGKPSAKDVTSRLSRASKFVNTRSKIATDDLLHQLSKHPEFKACTVSVRSQLRRAVRLYRDFLSR